MPKEKPILWLAYESSSALVLSFLIPLCEGQKANKLFCSSYSKWFQFKFNWWLGFHEKNFDHTFISIQKKIDCFFIFKYERSVLFLLIFKLSYTLVYEEEDAFEYRLFPPDFSVGLFQYIF